MRTAHPVMKIAKVPDKMTKASYKITKSPDKMTKAPDIIKELSAAVKPGKKDDLARFFKTGSGQYGEGDKFIGVMVPQQRKIAKQHRNLPLSEVQKLLNSDVHEHRLTALLIIVYAYNEADDDKKRLIYDFYLRNAGRVNNWDLVDLTAPNIIGSHIISHPEERKILYALSESKSLWEERIAIVGTFALIRKGKFSDTFTLAKRYLDHKHDLMHKATGWMLREVGKRDEMTLKVFLDKYAKRMPRTMLRYAIERLSEKDRKRYMKR